MIELIHADQASVFPYEIEDMHRLRHRVFNERLGWEVRSDNGIERDWFDNCKPAYLLYRAPDGRIGGCLRLLRTTGPNMLRDVFGTLLADEPAPADPAVWESSRFSVDFDIATERTPTQLNAATCELLCGILEFGLSIGLREVVSVFDVVMEKVLRRAGCPARRLGAPQRFGKAVAIAGAFEISERALIAARQAGGISTPVLRTYAWPNIPRAA